MQKNAVLGVSINFNKENLKNFILSFREVNQTDDLVLFVDSNNLPHLELAFKDYNVTFRNYYFHEFVDTPVHNTRYIKLLEFLLDNKHYKNIFLSDTKDVIFQSNPFDNADEDFLFFFQEDSGLKISDDYQHNGWWIESAYGPEILSLIQNEVVICSGTILGSYNRIVKLLHTIRTEFLKIKKERPTSFNGVILDQAVVNYLVRFPSVDNLFDFTVKVNGDIVGTLGASATGYPGALDNVLINTHSIMVAGQIPKIIHQYDRNEFLRSLFNEKFKLNS